MNPTVPPSADLARPFLPAKDFDLSKRFYEALGFEKTFDGEVALFRIGAGGFILQRYYQKEWAENFMMHWTPTPRSTGRGGSECFPPPHTPSTNPESGVRRWRTSCKTQNVTAD